MKIKSLPIRYFIAISVLCILQFSCKKIDLRTERDNSFSKLVSTLSATDTPTVYNSVWINGDQNNLFKDSNFRISVGAAFTDSITHQLITMTGVSVNSRSIVPKADHTFVFGYTDSASGPAGLAEGLALFGTNVRIKITG